MMQYAPCPKCRSTGAERMSFTWWGGLIGPKILTHVKCPGCGYAYNGKSGKDNTTGIVIYSVIVGLVVLGFVVVLIAAMAVFLAASR
jgi:predicted nucleic-acid-binding Zn-ribbon protein